jgi:hypothetical protein
MFKNSHFKQNKSLIVWSVFLFSANPIPNRQSVLTERIKKNIYIARPLLTFAQNILFTKITP